MSMRRCWMLWLTASASSFVAVTSATRLRCPVQRNHACRLSKRRQGGLISARPNGLTFDRRRHHLSSPPLQPRFRTLGRFAVSVRLPGTASSAVRDEARRRAAERARGLAGQGGAAWEAGQRLRAVVREPAVGVTAGTSRAHDLAGTWQQPGGDRLERRDGYRLATMRLQHGSDIRCRRPRTAAPRVAQARSGSHTGRSVRTCRQRCG